MDSPAVSNAEADKLSEDRGANKNQGEPVYARKPAHINFLSHLCQESAWNSF